MRRRSYGFVLGAALLILTVLLPLFITAKQLPETPQQQPRLRSRHCERHPDNPACIEDAAATNSVPKNENNRIETSHQVEEPLNQDTVAQQHPPESTEATLRPRQSLSARHAAKIVLSAVCLVVPLAALLGYMRRTQRIKKLDELEKEKEREVEIEVQALKADEAAEAEEAIQKRKCEKKVKKLKEEVKRLDIKERKEVAKKEALKHELESVIAHQEDRLDGDDELPGEPKSREQTSKTEPVKEEKETGTNEEREGEGDGESESTVIPKQRNRSTDILEQVTSSKSGSSRAMIAKHDTNEITTVDDKPATIQALVENLGIHYDDFLAIRPADRIALGLKLQNQDQKERQLRQNNDANRLKLLKNKIKAQGLIDRREHHRVVEEGGRESREEKKRYNTLAEGDRKGEAQERRRHNAEIERATRRREAIEAAHKAEIRHETFKYRLVLITFVLTVGAWFIALYSKVGVMIVIREVMADLLNAKELLGIFPPSPVSGFSWLSPTASVWAMITTVSYCLLGLAAICFVGYFLNYYCAIILLGVCFGRSALRLALYFGPVYGLEWLACFLLIRLALPLRFYRPPATTKTTTATGYEQIITALLFVVFGAFSIYVGIMAFHTDPLNPNSANGWLDLVWARVEARLF